MNAITIGDTVSAKGHDHRHQGVVIDVTEPTGRYVQVRWGPDDLCVEKADDLRRVPNAVRFLIDGKGAAVGGDVKAVRDIEFDGYSHVQFTLTPEGFIGDAFNEEGECYKTVAFTFEEFAELGA